MKRIGKILLVAGLIGIASTSMVSCLDDDDDAFYGNYISALVTVKPIDDDECYFQLDDNTTLYPLNLNRSPYGDKEVRALTFYTEMEGTTEDYTKNIHVLWLDSIRTKATVPTLGELNDETYGNDPIEIVNDWVTLAEDGYLTLRFRVLSSGTGRVHYLNLLTGVDPNDPYTVELRHDAKGDVAGVATDGLIAFHLGELPDTQGKTVKLTLKWKGYETEKSTTFDYCTRRNTTPGNNGLIDVETINLKVE